MRVINPQCVLLCLTSLILLDIIITPAIASPVLMFCVRNKRVVKGIEVRGWQ